MGKKEIHACISEELYYWLREYATQYIEQGYKNWLGKALEDAILSLMNSRGSKTRGRSHRTQKPIHGYLFNKLESKRLKNRLKCIWSRIEGRNAILLSELINIIFECAGSDYRTIAKYLNLLQAFGLRFHERNVCIIYIHHDNDIPLKQIKLDSKRLREIIEKCMK